MSTDQTKASLRKKILKLRDNLSQTEIELFSEKIYSRLFKNNIYQKAKYIMSYLNIGSEVRTEPIIHKAFNDNKNIVLAKTKKIDKNLELFEINNIEDIEIGPYGIREPIPEKSKTFEPNNLDLVLVPGVAYDLRGYRIGYGGGYYDRFLSNLPTEITSIGLAFEIQVVDKINNESYDQSVDIIITDKRLIIP